MGRRRRQSPIKSCAQKTRYESREDAESTITWIKEKEEEEEINLKTYYCGICGGYHLANKRRKDNL